MRLFIILFLSVFLIFSCQKEKGKLPSSGYEYILHTNSKGTKVEDWTKVYYHYQIRDENSVKESSYTFSKMPWIEIVEGAAHRKNSLLQEAILLMREGDSMTIIKPLENVYPKPKGFEESKFSYYDLAIKKVVGERYIPKKSDKELQDYLPEVKTLVERTIKDYRSNKLPNIKSTASGLKYVIHELGSGERPKKGELVRVHYYGALIDGQMFDNSFERAAEFPFGLGAGGTIEGWDEGIGLLNKGSKATLFIPSKLGYGTSGMGNIPPNSELIYYVELISSREL